MSSFIDHRGDGSNKSFLIPFEYYENDQLFAYVDDRLVEIEQYNKNSIVLKDIPPSGSLVRIRRIVDVDTPFATYVTGSDLTEDTLNKNNLKLLYGIQQLNDGFIDDDFYFKQDISMGNNRIIDVADGVDDTDAVNYSQVKNLDANVKQIEQNIIRLEQQAKASKDAAGVSETNAKTSETNAKTSEINSKTSETNSKTSETNSKTSEINAKTSEINSKDSELLAKQYEDAAKISETNAKDSELLTKQYADAAGVSETNAKQYADAAKVSETNSKTSETNSKTSETNAKVSETNAKESELLAKKYADESKSTKPDYKTIFIDTAGNIAAKDLVINGDDSDLASNRGQIGKCYSLTSGIDFNTLFKSGRYWFTNAIFAECSNKPPVNVGGFCDVLGEESGNSYTKQIYHVYNSPVIYIREHKGTTEGWNETWTRIITEKNLATTFAPGIVQLNNTTSSTSTSQAATAKAVKTTYDKVLEVETKADEALTKTDLPLGHIYLWPFSTPQDGSIQVNGSEYNRELYSDLWNLVKAKGWYKPEAEWQQIASANGGYCPWYSDGDGSTTFRTPKFAPYQKLALASGDAGKYIAEGLPNITGTFEGRGHATGNTQYGGALQPPSSGAFSMTIQGGTGTGTGTAESTTQDVPNDIVTLDASKSSHIYGNSTKVQPESNNWIVCVVAFGTATNVGSVDVANVMSAIERLQSLALLKSGGTLTGAVSEKLLSLSGTSVTLDLTSSNNFIHTITDNTTFTVSANSDTTFQLGTLVLTNAGSYTITWPESFKWADNTPPTLNSEGIDVITFFTIDGGTKYYAVQSITGVA